MGLKKPRLNVGKRWASGTASTGSTGKLTITGLNFTPSYVLTKEVNGTSTLNLSSAYGKKEALKTVAEINIRTSETGVVSNGWTTIQSGGFEVNMQLTDQNMSWIAFE